MTLAMFIRDKKAIVGFKTYMTNILQQLHLITPCVNNYLKIEGNKMELLQSQAPVDRELSRSSASARHGTFDIGHQTSDMGHGI